jgi:hypothetical protein
MYAVARISGVKMYAAARIVLRKCMRLHEFYPQFRFCLLPFPIDAVSRKMIVQNFRYHFRPLLAFDAGHQFQLLVDFRFQIKRAAVAERLRR